ncbi:MAG: acyl-CoA synthetase FdrA [Elusimicrobia bacterium]|nr:acyl-CoA synthetase FdrA [Elusimicrobiota bacterium]
MKIETLIKGGLYYDSVALMQAAKELSSMKGIIDSAVVMATAENKSIIKTSGLYTSDLHKASDNDLVIIVKADNGAIISKAFRKADEILKEKKKAVSSFLDTGKNARSLDNAFEMLEGANMAIISVAGKYAGSLADRCLDKNLNVMLFSDNISLETEIALKKKAVKKNLLVMGPDCGTAIINGAPLAFANSVKRGNIGIVAASGTGLQEVSCIISNEGGGVSQGIGTGSRDIKKEVGAITFIAALRDLANDPNTDIILLVSKPPYPSIMKKIILAAKNIKKPIVAVFLGGTLKAKLRDNFYFAKTLQEAALKAVYIAKEGKPHQANVRIFDINTGIEKIAIEHSKNKNFREKYLRGFFTGGTFASEAQIVLKDIIGKTWSNVPLDKKYKLKNSLMLKENSIVDLGEDEFTLGRPHPMIDYSLRNKLIVSESKKADIAVILLDMVLGYGSNMKPIADILPALRQAFKNNRKLSIVASVTGTETDPQTRSKVVNALKKAGVVVADSNASASKLAGEILRHTCLKKSQVTGCKSPVTSCRSPVSSHRSPVTTRKKQ